MELLIMTVIALLIIILSIYPYISTLRIVSPEAIDENMKKLKQESWFKQYLNDDQYRELIIHNKEVRKEIGRLHTNKLNKKTYRKL